MVFISRNLSKIEFSVVSAVTALGIMFLSFAAVIPSIYVLVLNDFSLNEDERKENSDKLSSLIVIVSCCILSGALAFSTDLANFLKINSSTPIVIYSFCLFFSLLLQISIGYGMGSHKYKSIQFQGLVLSISKFFLVMFFFFLLKPSVNSVLVSEGIATVVSMVVLLLVLKRWFKIKDISLINISSLKKYALGSLPISLNFMLTGILITGDIVLAKHLFEPSLAGEYAVGANLAKIAYFVSGALSAVMYAMVTKSLNEGDSGVSLVVSSATIASLAGGVIVVLSYLYPDDIIKFLFGVRYLPAANVFNILSISMTVLSVNTIFFNYFLAKKEYMYLKILFLILVFLAANVFLSRDMLPIDLAYAVLKAMVLMLFVNVLLLYRVAIKGYIKGFFVR